MCIFCDTVPREIETNRYVLQIGNQHTKLRVPPKPILGELMSFVGITYRNRKNPKAVASPRHNSPCVTKAVNPQLMELLGGSSAGRRVSFPGIYVLV